MKDRSKDADIGVNHELIGKPGWDKINGISAKIGDKVRVKAEISKERTGTVSKISKKGTVRLRNYGER